MMRQFLSRSAPAMLAIAWLATACGPFDPSIAASKVTLLATDGRVLAHHPEWKQGFIVEPNRDKRPFHVAANPGKALVLPGGAQTIWIDDRSGRLTVVDIAGGTSKTVATCHYCDQHDLSPDGRFLLLRMTAGRSVNAIVDPNQMTIVDLVDLRAADFTVGAPPAVVAFYNRGSDPRILLFSAGQLAQVRIRPLFSPEPDADWKQTRALSLQVDLNQVPTAMVQTATQVFVTIRDANEILAVYLGDDEMPAINFIAHDISHPVALALSPPVTAATDTVFPRQGTADTQFLYVLNADKTLTVFDTANLSRSQVVRTQAISAAPDTLVPTPDGRRVLFYEKGGRHLYRMNVRTGHVAAIPFQRAVSQFLHAPDGQSAIALHKDDDGEAFTYVNFTEVYEPVRLPSALNAHVLTPDGSRAVLRLAQRSELINVDLRTGRLSALQLADVDAETGGARFVPLHIGATGRGGEVFAWLDDPAGQIAFHDPATGKITRQTHILLGGILDR